MENTKAIQEILEIVQHLHGVTATKDDIAKMATKDDIAKIYEVMATKEDIRALCNEMFEHVDAFIFLHKEHDSEIAALAMRQGRAET